MKSKLKSERYGKYEKKANRIVKKVRKSKFNSEQIWKIQ
jgi:hypothetical protein